MATTTVPLSSPTAATRRRGLRVPVLLAGAAVAGLVAFVATRPGGDQSVGRVAPAFSLAEVRASGASVSLPAGTPAVVNFFAAWCVPCRAELPVLEQAHRQTAGEVAFVGVDVNDSRRAAAELLEATGVTFPAGYDPDRAVATSYGLRGMPTTVFVDGAGRIDAVTQGELTAAELDRRLAGLGVGTR